MVGVNGRLGYGTLGLLLILHTACDPTGLSTWFGTSLVFLLPLVGLVAWMRSILQATPALRWGQRIQLGLYRLQVFTSADAGERWLALAWESHDPALALVLAQRAAAVGNAEAHYELGLHQRQSGLRDEGAARIHFQAAADRGHAAGAFQVGEAHRWGLGTVRSPAEARVWYERAARAGHRQAVSVLATALETGDGLIADPDAALRWRARLVQLPEAFENAEDITRHALRQREETVSARWTRQGMARLDSLSERVPGRPWMLYLGLVVGAVVLLTLAGIVFIGMAGFFFIPAIALVPVIPGLLYMHFRGHRPSRKLLRMEQRAEAGDAASAFRLGMAYKVGTPDLPRDHNLARQWLRKAVDAGHAGAMVQLAELLSWGSGGAKDVPEARRLLEAAREAGDPEAKARLARLEPSEPEPATNPPNPR